MTATQEQLAALTVPATLPGVVRRGTPVRPTRDHAWHDARGYPCSAKADSVVRGAPCSGYPSVYLCDWGNTPIANCLVDLTDATGRAHVAWAVAGKVAGMAVAALWDGTPDGPTGQRHCIWRLRWRSLSWPLPPAGTGAHTFTGRDVPALLNLVPDDDTRLPDGSRLVDALALQAVALHVLGAGGAA